MYATSSNSLSYEVDVLVLISINEMDIVSPPGSNVTFDIFEIRNSIRGILSDKKFEISKAQIYT